ncbi:MAG: glycosyltransferase family 2 protein [Verrucomicrobiae bacterium]|nr:glycosyltransferase family 2 protein [Verrucomicrobiae bacterium]
MKDDLAELPRVSVVIPTLNSSATLGRCLDSILTQDYPRERIEILICDGGSVDGTREIAEKRGVDLLLENFLKTGESGKALGLRRSTGEMVAFVDSDNVLVGTDWLRRMVAPFCVPEIILTEPLYFQWNSEDPGITRYCALMGLNDPLCHYTGNYDRWNTATGRWTGLSLAVQDEGDWLWFEGDEKTVLPTIGANGTIYRREALIGIMDQDYFFDVDIPPRLCQKGKVGFAKVKLGITHLYCRHLRDFCRKQRRRVRDYLGFKLQRGSPKSKGGYSLGGISLFVLSCLTVIPLLATVLKGYKRKPDWAWFWHIPLSWATLVIYGSETLLALISPRKCDRRNWQAR